MGLVWLVILSCALAAYIICRHKALLQARQMGGIRFLHSLPSYYGWHAAMLSLIPPILLLLIWYGFEGVVIRSLVLDSLPVSFLDAFASQNTQSLLVSQIANVSRGLTTSSDPIINQAAHYYRTLSAHSTTLLQTITIIMAVLGLISGWFLVRPKIKARHYVEKVMQAFLWVCSLVAIITTIGILLSVLFEAIRFFHLIPVSDFLFGTQWSPQIAIRADQQGASGAFGAIPLFSGTLMITVIAMCIAAPIGLLSAIYLSEYATERVRNIAKPLLEILAGVPTVVYGYFAALTAAPLIRQLATSLGIDSASSESALAAGMVMGMMIIPFVSSLSDDVIRAVPKDLRDAALALGATPSEAITKVVLPAALPGIVGGLLLAVSRAIGETMIVVMAAGLSANLTANPLDSVTTITVQIVTLLVGDQEFDNPKTLAAFALGLTLFVVTLLLNFIALHIVRKYREQYD
ncbi:phosphate ABC transporter permease subunit PstC [Photobacterium sp. OFAV2-7]|uniref:phosphate ABC transporter permease subunit PstC n=1 Tax=Photobacterium sp. OFAV2-7 TaxID=2917748 RepID=UPI001EF53C0F|nr:phosphate ABC transporter permease subunit PstC [Photobacterium sp. OFAV2-7]MCG7586243.1 phosphate ABC transporter permease subunit PstC [Photobacterium sp. OFAV2-7]